MDTSVVDNACSSDMSDVHTSPKLTDHTDASSNIDYRSTIKLQMLEHVARSDGHFKHQQRGDPDLTYDEKLEIAKDLLENKPATFLSRYSKYITHEHIGYFDDKLDDYTINFYITEIRKQESEQKSHVKVRNRRYEAMKQLLHKGEYFSDRETKARDPLLYEQMVGRYLSEDELQKQVEENDGSIASVLMQHVEAIHNNELYARQVDQQESQMEEEEEEAGEEEMDEDSEESELEDDQPERKLSISSQEKSVLRGEFLATMQERFLSGQDPDFDYSTVDNNVEFDSLDIREQDEEERYFDDESTCDDEDDLKDRLNSCHVESRGSTQITSDNCNATTELDSNPPMSDPT